jgi:1,4-alpha-glucan branching enzyme
LTAFEDGRSVESTSDRSKERISMSAQKLPKQKVTFSLVAPHAQSVSVAGDFTSWQQGPIEMKKHKGGIWKKTVSLAPGEHQYRLLVDGQWQDDPNCLLHYPNEFGGQNCVCIVTSANPISSTSL